jgi:hypothetical protein
MTKIVLEFSEGLQVNYSCEGGMSHRIKVFCFCNSMQTGVRSDGRSITDVRPIQSLCSLLPRTHGSALFTRGETQVLEAPNTHFCVINLQGCYYCGSSYLTIDRRSL